MKREIKFRAFQDNKMITSPISSNYGLQRFFGFLYEDAPVMQFTGLKDKNGKDIFEGDVLIFDDKWEWYRGSYGIKMLFANKEEKEKLLLQYNNEPEEIRVIDDMRESWLDSSEVQSYWKIIGNIYENPELL